MKFKVGDKVTIIGDSHVASGIVFIRPMHKYIGKSAIITKPEKSPGYDDIHYSLDIDNEAFKWDESWLKHTSWKERMTE